MNVLFCFSQVNLAVLSDGEEKELPDELENVCSGNIDGNCLLVHLSFPNQNLVHTCLPFYFL